VSIAAQQAAAELTPQLMAIAAERLECAVDDLQPAGSGYQVKGSPTPRVETVDLVAEAARRAGGRLQAKAAGPDRTTRSKLMCEVVCVAEVEVDPETGQVKPVRLIMVTDSGQPIDPRLLEGQIEGAAVQGFGMTL